MATSNLMETQTAFVRKWKPYAQQAARELGIPWEWILAQWGLESGYGTASANTPAMMNLQKNNPADLRTNAGWLSFTTPSQFVSSYVATIRNDFPQVSNADNIATAFATPQRSGMSYYGTESAKEYASSLMNSLTQLAHITNTDVPLFRASNISNLLNQEALLGKGPPYEVTQGNSSLPFIPAIVGSGKQTVTQAVEGQVPSLSPMTHGQGLFAGLQQWFQGIATRVFSIIIGGTLIVAGVIILASQSKEVKTVVRTVR